MATFSERNGKWQVKVVRKGYPIQYRTFAAKAEAQAWARRIESAMDDGTLVDPAGSSQILFGALIARYQKSVTQSKRSRQSEVYRLEALQRHKIASFSMSNLTASVLADYRDERLKSVSSATVCRELATIGAVITHAQREWGLKTPNPAKVIKKPRLPPGRNRILKPEEMDRLFVALNASGHALRNKWLVPLVKLALATAMRRGELLSLLWRNVDLETRTAYLPMTKNGKDRYVPLSTVAVDQLKSLPREDEHVLPVSDYTVECAWVRACKRAGIENFRFHDLRHMATTELSKKLPNVIELSAVTGHSNVQNLKRYYHIAVSELSKKLG